MNKVLMFLLCFMQAQTHTEVFNVDAQELVIDGTALDRYHSDSTTGVINVPTYAVYNTPIIHDNVSRTLNSAFTLAGTSGTLCTYAYSVQVAVAVLGTGTVQPQYSTNGGSTWINLPKVTSTGLITTQTLQVNGSCPANAQFKIVTSSTGTVTFTYIDGQETY